MKIKGKLVLDKELISIWNIKKTQLITNQTKKIEAIVKRIQVQLRIKIKITSKGWNTILRHLYDFDTVDINNIYLYYLYILTNFYFIIKKKINFNFII